MALAEAAAVLGTRAPGAGSFTSVSTDTRTLGAGALFVALRGPRHDGHAHLPAARAAGAVAAVVDHPVADALMQLTVPDTLAALHALARAWRARFALPLIGVTGSNGKTTVKEMLAAILGRRGPVLATRGNRNNAIGVPLTLLDLRAQHTAAVIEMGMNAPGEIAVLADLARPDAGLITNAGPAHLEGLGTVEAVARAKGELIAGLPAPATAVINADDAHAALWRTLAGPRRVLTFGLGAQADVRAQAQPDAHGSTLTLHTPAGRTQLRLRLPGAHNARNAAAACAGALTLGAALDDVAAGLEAMTPVPGRLCPRAGWDAGVGLLDDSYNANPASLAAAVEVLGALPGTRVLVLGDMGELGPQAGALHARAGADARAAGVDALHAVGPLAAQAARAFGVGGQAHADLAALAAAVRGIAARPLWVLVKGSRAAGMERAVAALAGAEGA